MSTTAPRVLIWGMTDTFSGVEKFSNTESGNNEDRLCISLWDCKWTGIQVFEISCTKTHYRPHVLKLCPYGTKLHVLKRIVILLASKVNDDIFVSFISTSSGNFLSLERTEKWRVEWELIHTCTPCHYQDIITPFMLLLIKDVPFLRTA